jgi:hypothetical protein
MSENSQSRLKMPDLPGQHRRLRASAPFGRAWPCAPVTFTLCRIKHGRWTAMRLRRIATTDNLTGAKLKEIRRVLED